MRARSISKTKQAMQLRWAPANCSLFRRGFVRKYFVSSIKRSGLNLARDLIALEISGQFTAGQAHGRIFPRQSQSGAENLCPAQSILMDFIDNPQKTMHLPRPVRVGIKATGSMQWFLNLMEELGIECQVGHPAQIRASAPRKQKNDRRDAELILKLLVEGRFPAIWLPSKELLDLRALLRHRHQWVRMRMRIQNSLQSIALANGLRRGTALWSHEGQNRIALLPLAPHAAYRRSELQAMYEKFEGGDRETKPASRGASLQTSRSTAADDPSWSGTGHSVGDRGVPGRSSAIRRQQGPG